MSEGVVSQDWLPIPARCAPPEALVIVYHGTDNAPRQGVLEVNRPLCVGVHMSIVTHWHQLVKTFWIDSGLRQYLEESMETTVEKLTYSVPGFAKAIGVSRSNAYDLVAQGYIPSVRLRGRVLIPRKAVEEFLSGAKAKAA